MVQPTEVVPGVQAWPRSSICRAVRESLAVLPDFTMETRNLVYENTERNILFFVLIKDVLLSLHHRNKVKPYLNLNIKYSCINKTDQTTKSMQKLNSSQSDSGWGCDRTLTGRYSEQRVTDNEPTPVWRHGFFFCFCCWNVHTHHKLPASTWDDRLNYSDNLCSVRCVLFLE